MRALDAPKDAGAENESIKLNGARKHKNWKWKQELGTQKIAARAPRALRAHSSYGVRVETRCAPRTVPRALR